VNGCLPDTQQARLAMSTGIILTMADKAQGKRRKNAEPKDLSAFFCAFAAFRPVR
jgi:hypothetical protein